jgi:phage terminase large subunit-like protein
LLNRYNGERNHIALVAASYKMGAYLATRLAKTYGEKYGEYPTYESTKLRMTFPNGARLDVYSSENPERLRGSQSDFVWAHDVGLWGSLSTLDVAMYGNRLGSNPMVLVSVDKPE